AARIVAARGSDGLSSVEELLKVDGIGPDLLYGSPAEPNGGHIPAGSAVAVPPLASLVTVFSFDPDVQLGLGPGGGGHRGELRLNINTPWSERLERALAKRFDQSFVEGAKGILKGRKLERDGDIASLLAQFKVDPKQWVQAFDVFTTSPDPYL